MGYQLETDHAARLVHVRLGGRVDAAMMLRVVDELEARGLPTYRRLWDFTGIDAIIMSPNDLQDLADSAVERQQRFGPKAGRIAAVTRDVDSYTVAMIVQHLAARRGVPAKVFRSFEEARSWLLEPVPGVGPDVGVVDET